jgi:hypothetical protein
MGPASNDQRIARHPDRRPTRLGQAAERHPPPERRAERAAYQAAKTDLLARIAATNCHTTED